MTRERLRKYRSRKPGISSAGPRDCLAGRSCLISCRSGHILKNGQFRPEETANWERAASHLGHLGLYVLPAIVILIGWAEVDFGGHGVEWFGYVMPKIFPTMETLLGFDVESLASLLHEWLAYALLALAAVHVAAVIKHRRDGHEVMHRMSMTSAKKD